MRLSAIDWITRGGIIGAGALAIFAIWGGFAHAEGAAVNEQPDGACATYSLSHLEADFPKSKFVELNKGQFASVRAAVEGSGSPFPGDVAAIDVTTALNDDGSDASDTMVLFGVDDKGCIVGHMQMPSSVFDAIMASPPA